MSWASSRPAPDVAEASGGAEGSKRKLTRQSGAGQAPKAARRSDAGDVPLILVLSAANIHESAAFEDLVDAVASTEADRAYDPKSTRWQQEGGVAYREATRGHRLLDCFSGVSFLRNACPTSSPENTGVELIGAISFLIL